MKMDENGGLTISTGEVSWMNFMGITWDFQGARPFVAPLRRLWRSEAGLNERTGRVWWLLESEPWDFEWIFRLGLGIGMCGI